MKIHLHEIREIDTDLDFTQDEPWVAKAVAQVDESFEETKKIAPPNAEKKSRPIQVHFNLRQVDDVVVITGKIKTTIELICSRCATSFAMPAQPSFSALYCKDPEMAGVGYLQKVGPKGEEEERPAGQNRGYARHQHDPDHERDVESGKDLDITYISEDTINLEDVLTEQLQLQVPFQPLCNKDCKGMCTQCGADLNVGRCACKKIGTLAFSVLADFKP